MLALVVVVRVVRWLTRATAKGMLVAFSVSGFGAFATPILAPTPPMGWSSWYGLRCNFDESTLRTTADRLIESGLKSSGYNRLNVDDCWATARDVDGRLQADGRRFPSGMKALGDYVHQRGLKFGLYTSAGISTCQRDLQKDASRLPIGSRGHEFADMRQFAKWGADFVKVDWCGHYASQDSASSYETFHDAIAASGRPMLLSICEWGIAKPWDWARGVGEMWRISMDTQNCWACQTAWGGIGVVQTFDVLAEHAGEGGINGWNDPDNLMIGNGLLTPAEERAQISLYAMAAAPLIIAGDLRTIPRGAIETLSNRDVIAVDQDRLGKPGQRIRSEDGEEVWVRELSGGRRAVLLFNRSARVRTITLRWTELDLAPNTTFGQAREAWTERKVREGQGLSQRLAAHDVALFLVGPSSQGGPIRPPV